MLGYYFDNQGLILFVETKNRLGKASRVPIQEWIHVVSQMYKPAARVIDYFLSNQFGEGDYVLIPYEEANNLPDYVTTSLGIEPLSDILNITNSGHVFQDSFSVNVTWRSVESRPLVGASLKGPFLFLAGKCRGRLPNVTCTVSSVVEKINSATTQEDRLAFLAELSDVFSGEMGLLDRVHLDGYIKNVRIYHTSSFSLDIKTDHGSFKFDPVLYHKAGSNKDMNRVLPPKYEEIFLEKIFAQKGGRDSYLLDGEVYLVTTPSMAKVLSLVHKVQRSDLESQKSFLKNPRGYIRNALEEESLSEEELEMIFLETREYSDRVEGVGLWQPPVVPWVQKKSEDWLPAEEVLGLKVGDKVISFSGDDVSEIQKLVSTAKENGSEFIEHKGIKIPVNQDLEESIKVLVSEVRPQNYPEQEVERAQNHARFVLQVKNNLGTITYTPTFANRGNSLNKIRSNLMKNTPMDYQDDGIRWLQNSWASGVSGVLLADDMGLGKTFQVLYFMCWLKEYMQSEEKDAPILIVAPTSLLRNWEKEAEQHLHSIDELGTLVRLQGGDLNYLRKGKGNDLVMGSPQLDYEEIQNAGWVLVSYETMRDYEHSLGKVKFSLIVFDEIQKLKSPRSLVTKSAKAMQADFLIGLTGTPVENRLADLHTICDVLRPGYLGSLKDFSAKYENGLDEKLLISLKRTLESADGNIPPFLLRRMKGDQLKGLPKKTIISCRETMPKQQANAYEEIVTQAKENGREMLKYLQLMRNTSLHPYKYDEVSTQKVLDKKYIQDSAKFVQCFKILDEIYAKGEKVLIFLESREVQPTLKRLISKRYDIPLLSIPIVNGEMVGPQRQKMVNTFQDEVQGFGVMILSPKAAGTGLTITAANHVIHLSRWWNPAVEDQSTDRAYRMGQSKDVFVYYPMSIHPQYEDFSFDVLLDQLIERKRKLANELLQPVASMKDDIEALSLFEEIINGSNASERAEGSVHVLQEVDCIDHRSFEYWIEAKYREKGFATARTRKSWDCGLDVLASRNGEYYLVQCKHTGVNASKKCTSDVVEELLTAKSSYENSEIKNCKLVAITNHSGYSRKVIEKAKNFDIELVSRDGLVSYFNDL